MSVICIKQIILKREIKTYIISLGPWRLALVIKVSGASSNLQRLPEASGSGQQTFPSSSGL